jgi:hypothetical protein
MNGSATRAEKRCGESGGAPADSSYMLAVRMAAAMTKDWPASSPLMPA